MIGGLRSSQSGELCEASEKLLLKTRRKIGYIFQSHNLLNSLTVRENVEMSLELHDHYYNQKKRKAAENNRHLLEKSTKVWRVVGGRGTRRLVLRNKGTPVEN